MHAFNSEGLASMVSYVDESGIVVSAGAALALSDIIGEEDDIEITLSSSCMAQVEKMVWHTALSVSNQCERMDARCAGQRKEKNYGRKQDQTLSKKGLGRIRKTTNPEVANAVAESSNTSTPAEENMDLQKVAKKHKVKANMKSELIIKEIVKMTKLGGLVPGLLLQISKIAVKVSVLLLRKTTPHPDTNTALNGSIAEIKFTVRHWKIEDHDTFQALVEKINILRLGTVHHKTNYKCPHINNDKDQPEKKKIHEDAQDADASSSKASGLKTK
ncbi:hypothetical protein F4604DRAFT_1970197 [Suillus subluteus]|nr:hypothetical protein F4604DRAFT_1970197 [Suillus subluteus]